MFERMDHVAMSVRDMEKAIAFYQDVVGMEKVFDREFDTPMARLIGVEGTRVRIVHMKFHDTVLELFDYHYPPGREPRPDRQQSDSPIHIGFMVKDFWATYRDLKERGSSSRESDRDPPRRVRRLFPRRRVRSVRDSRDPAPELATAGGRVDAITSAATKGYRMSRRIEQRPPRPATRKADG